MRQMWSHPLHAYSVSALWTLPPPALLPPPLPLLDSVLCGLETPVREPWGGNPILGSPAEGRIVSVSVIAYDVWACWMSLGVAGSRRALVRLGREGQQG